MNIIWLGHGSFRIEIGDQVLLIDPWLSGNPMLAEDSMPPHFRERRKSSSHMAISITPKTSQWSPKRPAHHLQAWSS